MNLIDSSSHVWSFLFWTCHVWYKVKSNTCYIFSSIFFFMASVKLLHTLHLLQKFFVYYFYLNVFRQTQQNKSLMKSLEHKQEEAFSDVIWDVQLGRFILLSVPFSQQLPSLTCLYFFRFLNWPSKLDWAFPWQLSGGSEQFFSPEKWKLFPWKKLITMHPSCNFHPSYLHINLRSFYWVSGLYNLHLWPVRTHIILPSS